jgi:hypothetical protein
MGRTAAESQEGGAEDIQCREPYGDEARLDERLLYTDGHNCLQHAARQQLRHEARVQTQHNSAGERRRRETSG